MCLVGKCIYLNVNEVEISLDSVCNQPQIVLGFGHMVVLIMVAMCMHTLNAIQPM